MYEYLTVDIDVYNQTDLGLLRVTISEFIYLLGCESIDGSLLMLSTRCRLFQIAVV